MFIHVTEGDVTNEDQFRGISISYNRKRVGVVSGSGLGNID